MRTVIQPAAAWAISPSRPSGRPIPGPTDSTGNVSTTGSAKGKKPARPKTTASRLAATATAPIPPTAAVSAATPVGTGRLGSSSTQSPPSVTPPSSGSAQAGEPVQAVASAMPQPATVQIRSRCQGRTPASSSIGTEAATRTSARSRDTAAA